MQLTSVYSSLFSSYSKVIRLEHSRQHFLRRSQAGQTAGTTLHPQRRQENPCLRRRYLQILRVQKPLQGACIRDDQRTEPLPPLGRCCISSQSTKHHFRCWSFEPTAGTATDRGRETGWLGSRCSQRRGVTTSQRRTGRRGNTFQANHGLAGCPGQGRTTRTINDSSGHTSPAQDGPPRHDSSGGCG